MNLDLLRAMAAMTKIEQKNFLEMQPHNIQLIFRNNDSDFLRKQIGGDDRRAAKNSVFQL